MSFAEYVTALRAFFGVPDDAPLLAAVEMMNVAMDIAGVKNTLGVKKTLVGRLRKTAHALPSSKKPVRPCNLCFLNGAP